MELANQTGAESYREQDSAMSPPLSQQELEFSNDHEQ